MACMFVTLDVLKVRGWLNANARWNILLMSVTLEVSKLSDWLKAVASSNISCIVSTLDVSKLSGWLNMTAFENKWAMFVTLDVSQLDMSALKFFKLQKRQLMSVIAETHQSAMGPYVAMATAGFAS